MGMEDATADDRGRDLRSERARPGGTGLAGVSAGAGPAALGPGAGIDPPPPDCSVYRFQPDPRLSGTVSCPRDVCGVNGVWLGRGVPFRTLNLDRTPNDKGLAISSFVSGYGEPLGVDVTGDQLIGLSASGPVTGTYLKNAVLTLARFAPDGTLPIRDFIDFKIIDVSYQNFAAECKSPYRCDNRQVPIYTFTARTHSGCDVQICQPGLVADDNNPSNLAGNAMFFEGDLYDETSFGITIMPKSLNLKGTFNLACVGTTISKLHLLRHTSASQSPHVPEAEQPTQAQRETLLRLFTGDYCGNGSRQLFTQNGVPLRIWFDSDVYQPTYESHFRVGPGDIRDGRWNENGATCIGVPRLSLVPGMTDVLPKIEEACNYASPPHDLPYCGYGDTPGYAFSDNPPPSPSPPPPPPPPSDAGSPPYDSDSPPYDSDSSPH